MTCGPKEDKKFEVLVTKWGEEVAAWAWWLYVNSEPPAYHLEPMQHVDKYSKGDGNIFARQVEDTSAITRFPLSAFLAVSQGFEVQAAMHKEMFDAAWENYQEEKKKDPTTKWNWRRVDGDYQTQLVIENAYRGVHKAMEPKTKMVNKKWGYADRTPREEDEF
jgi:uncharacterized protein YozE (UPF0346 family)